MGFPSAPGFKITLKPADPSLLDAASLKTQLENVGLNCSQLTTENLDSYISDVKAKMPQGTTQTYGILAPSDDLKGAQSAEAVQARADAVQAKRDSGELVSMAEATDNLVSAATGDWSVVNETVDQGCLQIIQVKDHFEWLYENRATNGFTGFVTPTKTQSQYDTNEKSVQSLFSNVLYMMADAVVKGLDNSSLQATVSNIVQANTQDSQNYTTTGSRVLHLVDGYDSNGNANGIGTLTMTYTLTVQNYKKKTKDGGDKHQASITVDAWSVLYNDPETLCKNYNAVLKQFKIDPNTAPTCLS